jgi:hypothetical protein
MEQHQRVYSFRLSLKLIRGIKEGASAIGNKELMLQ